MLELSYSFVCDIDVDVVVGFLVINEGNDDWCLIWPLLYSLLYPVPVKKDDFLKHSGHI